MSDTTDLIEAYLTAVADPSVTAEQVGSLLHAEYTFHEWPNAVNPHGSKRDRSASLAALLRGRGMLTRQSFEVHDHVAAGGLVATRLTWRGTLAVSVGHMPAGSTLTAHVSQHTVVREGLIWRTESYDCYEPPVPPTAG